MISPQTDASRTRQAELQIQARVAAELKKLSQAESEVLANATKSLEAADPKAGERSHYTVSKEIQDLRSKLEASKKVRPVPESLENARGDVVRCLRDNDRRPLDCWQEIENFKVEVKKLEATWVNKVTS